MIESTELAEMRDRLNNTSDGLTRAESRALLDDIARLYEGIDWISFSRNRARAANQRVRELHGQETFIGYCTACGYAPPCPTIRALDGGEQ